MAKQAAAKVEGSLDAGRYCLFSAIEPIQQQTMLRCGLCSLKKFAHSVLEQQTIM
jgi:hypothetical protein